MTESDSVKQIWQAYIDTVGEAAASGLNYTAWHFCDNESDAQELADLVNAGVKRATSSALWEYENDVDPIPCVGDYSVIIDFHGNAQLIIKTTKVDIVPFNRVTEEFAAKEGEGDKSLAYWRKLHRDCFSRYIELYGLTFDDDMPVVCEQFDVIFPLDLV
jgi:uncharacterized protein YhfF